MIHAARHSAEMKDVVATLERLGVDASMSKATVNKLDHLAEPNCVDKLCADGGKMKYKEAMKHFMKNRC